MVELVYNIAEIWRRQGAIGKELLVGFLKGSNGFLLPVARDENVIGRNTNLPETSEYIATIIQ